MDDLEAYVASLRSVIKEQAAEIEKLKAAGQHDCIDRLFDFKTKLEAAEAEAKVLRRGLEEVARQAAINLQLARP